MNFKKTPLLIILLTFLFPFTYSDCLDSPIYISQEFSTFEYLTWKLFSQRDLNSTDFINSYSNFDLIIPSNKFCLDSQFYKSAFLIPNPSDSLWSLWQTYGVLYGYTFHEFVISNMIANNGGVGSTYEKSMRTLDLSNQFDPYPQNDLSKSGNSNLGKIYLNSVFDVNYQTNLTKKNLAIFNSVTSNKNKNIDFLLTNLDPTFIPDYKEISMNFSDLSKLNLDVKVIIYNQSNLDKSSISLATYSNLIYRLEFTESPRNNKPADYDPILILISPNQIFSISFLPDSPFLEYDSNFFFDLINLGTNHLKDNKDISSILKGISLKIKLSKELTQNPQTSKDESLISQLP